MVASAQMPEVGIYSIYTTILTSLKGKTVIVIYLQLTIFISTNYLKPKLIYMVLNAI